MVATTAGYPSTSWQTPPAPSIFSRAVLENPCAWTVRLLDNSPCPSTFTGTPLRVARPAARRLSGVTSAPSSKRASRSRRFTGCVCVRPYCSNGIDFFMCGPRSFRIRMWIGICPPSAFGRLLAPEREPAPFWPRPLVLPTPEPSPRPTRLRRCRDPAAGFSECRPISGIVNSYEMADHLDLSAHRRLVRTLDRPADLPEAESAERVALLRVG